MSLIQTVHLTMGNYKSPMVVPAVQNDSDRQLKMIVDDFTLSNSMTGKMTFKRADGTFYEAEATLALADNAFVAELDQALTCPGRTLAQLKVTATDTVSTFTFVVWVEADTSGTLTPQEGISLSEAVQRAEDAADRAAASSGGQPTAITLASQMIDTHKLYIYLGNESGYEYGYIYAYTNGEWHATTLYGVGQDGTDGFSPSVSLTPTAYGVDITVTDENGSHSASVENGTATDAQVSAWLNAHPEATTTVQDGSITVSKLSSDLIANINSPLYELGILYDLTGTDGLIRCNFVNNVPVPSDSGTAYVTDYISKEDFRALGMTVVLKKSTPLVRFYDSEKNYLSQAYRLMTPTAAWATNAEYIVLEGNQNTAYGSPYQVQYNKQKTAVIMNNYAKGTELYKIEEKTLVITSDANKQVDVSSFPLIQGETYSVTTRGYAIFDIRNESGIKYRSFGGNNVSGVTYTINAGETKAVLGDINANVTFSITGKFPVEIKTMPEMSLVAENFNEEAFETIADGLGLHSGQGTDAIYYNCTHYGVIPANADNTSALNALITTVNANGGGVIWIPNGTYNFLKDSSTSASRGNAQINVYLKSNVSILGESLDSTVLKLSGSTNTGCSLFGYFATDNSDEVLRGCTFSNFTVDMSELTMATYSHKGKAFHTSGIKDCIFRDLRLLSTPSTSLGIDMLDNVVIDSVYVYQGGRQWAPGGSGGAGIGIGTGKWTNENYIIRNCICDSCGHFGIFLEDQGMFDSPPTKKYSKGQIIANNVVRNGRNYGIGLRGGRYVSITGNNVYSNSVGGIYLDYGADQSMISNNLISDTTNAVCFGNENDVACTEIAVINNVFSGCTNGVVQTLAPSDCVFQNNVTM